MKLENGGHYRIIKIFSLAGRPNGQGAVEPITAGYEIKGVLIGVPMIGQPFEVVRYERNGVPALGLFSSSEIVDIDENPSRAMSSPSCAVVKTQNSMYQFSPLAEPIPDSVMSILSRTHHGSL